MALKRGEMAKDAVAAMHLNDDPLPLQRKTIWHDDDHDEAQAIQQQQNQLKESMTTEVSDRHSLKKMSQLLVHRKQKFSSSDTKGSTKKKKTKKDKMRVTIDAYGESGDDSKKTRKNSFNNGSAKKKREEVILRYF